MCAQIERAAEDEDLERVPPLMERLHTEYVRALGALRTIEREAS